MVSLPNIYLSNCYFLFWILCTSRTIKKADHCGTKGHFMEAHFPTLVHICVVFFRAQCFPIMTWPSAAVIRNLSHLFLSFSTLTYLPLLHLMPKKNYGPRSLGQGLLMFFCLFVCLFELPWIILMYWQVENHWPTASCTPGIPNWGRWGNWGSQKGYSLFTLTHQQACLAWTCILHSNSDFIFGWLGFLILILWFVLREANIFYTRCGLS